MLSDKSGALIIVRVARVSDRAEVVSSIADQTGTGSGTGNDDFLLQEFNRMVEDDSVLLLYAEDAKTRQGLGMMAVVWSSPMESYWQSLRVSQAARGRGIASRLFNVASNIALARQGADSIARWGVVSSNEIMTAWSARIGLHGPQKFRRYGATASAEPPPLPAGYALREATPADESAIMAFCSAAPVWSSEFGSQNFVHSGWAEFSLQELRDATAHAPSRGIPAPSPQVLLDGSGAIVAFANLAILQFGERRVFMFRYVDGSADGVRMLLHCLPSLAHRHECHAAGGYVPTLPWLLALLDESAVYSRMTQTEQHEFHWKNAEFASMAEVSLAERMTPSKLVASAKLLCDLVRVHAVREWPSKLLTAIPELSSLREWSARFLPVRG